MTEGALSGKRTDRPVFVFSAGWRSGSTLIQRLVTSTGEVLVWGESGGALGCLHDAQRRFEQMLGHGNRRYRHGFGGNGSAQYEKFAQQPKEGALEWIACLNPPLEHFRKTVVEMLDEYYAKTARQLGYSRWGVKEVMALADDAIWLRTLIPDSKFVFLVRHPVDCIRSLKEFGWMDRPDDPRALEYYANHWITAARGFKALEFGKLLRYEDLISSPQVLQELESYLDIPALDTSLLKRRVRGKARSSEGLTWRERRRANAIVGEEMKSFGY